MKLTAGAVRYDLGLFRSMIVVAPNAVFHGSRLQPASELAGSVTADHGSAWGIGVEQLRVWPPSRPMSLHGVPRGSVPLSHCGTNNIIGRQRQALASSGFAAHGTNETPVEIRGATCNRWWTIHSEERKFPGIDARPGAVIDNGKRGKWNLLEGWGHDARSAIAPDRADRRALSSSISRPEPLHY